MELKVGEELEVEVQAASSLGVVDAPLTLVFDPALLRYLGAEAGDFLRKDAGNVIFLANGTSRAGEVTLGVGRTDRSHGVSGEGTLLRVRFSALAPGEPTFQILHAMAWGEAGVPLQVEKNSIGVSIR